MANQMGAVVDTDGGGIEGRPAMAAAAVETPKSEKPNVADRIVDAVRHAAHVSHEARLVRSLACDAIEDGAHEAKRAVKKSVRRGIERLEDVKDESAVALAAGVGLMVGMAAIWISGRSSRQPAGKD
jgi:hypothetical protein